MAIDFSSTSIFRLSGVGNGVRVRFSSFKFASGWNEFAVLSRLSGCDGSLMVSNAVLTFRPRCTVVNFRSSASSFACWKGMKLRPGFKGQKVGLLTLNTQILESTNEYSR